MVNMLLVPAMPHHLTSTPVESSPYKAWSLRHQVFALAFGGLASSVAPVALAFTLTADSFLTRKVSRCTS